MFFEIRSQNSCYLSIRDIRDPEMSGNEKGIRMSRIVQKMRSLKRILSRAIYHRMECAFFGYYEGDPFKLREDPAKRNRDILLEKYTELQQNDYEDVCKQLKVVFSKYAIDVWQNDLRTFIDELARRSLVYNSSVRLVHASGLILYTIVRVMAETRPYLRILETGTARGFGSTVMAKALYDSGCDGNIITVDVLPTSGELLWTGLGIPFRPITRYELLEPWSNLVERYITYLQLDSPRSLNRLGIKHINFAFVDAMHDYDSAIGEANYIASHQKSGDMVLFDDVGVQFPGVKKAVDEIKTNKGYAVVTSFRTKYRPQPWLLLEKR